MRQIFIIHGGDTFDSYDQYRTNLELKRLDYARLKPKMSWHAWLATQLRDDDVLSPSMPNSSNAQYDEWEIMFEKLIPFFEENVILIGHSLGAIFLAKYLSRHTLPVRLRMLVFVAAPYDDETSESLGTFRFESRPIIPAAIADEIHFMHARDDAVVPFGEIKKYQQVVPTASFHEYETGNHFFGETFPELLTIIKK